MKTVPTQRLYFKRFTSCIKLKVANVKKADSVKGNKHIKEIKSFLSKHSVQNRTRLDWGFADKNIDIVFSIYLNDETTLNNIINEFPSLISWVSRPASDFHRELLLTNTEIIFRERLLYGRFKYRINFNVGWKREHYPEISNWIKSQFGHKEEGRKGEYMLMGYWTPSLYLIDDTDLTLVKLSLGEYVSSVIRIDRLSDYGLTEKDLVAV